MSQSQFKKILATVICLIAISGFLQISKLAYKEARVIGDLLHRQNSNHENLLSAGALRPTDHLQLPDIILYRRTKKSGSTSMVKTLRSSLGKLGYVDVNLVNPSMQWIARAASVNAVHKRYLFSNHNNLVRSDFRSKHVVILDTLRDGYKQITSFCRHVKLVNECGPDLEECMLSNSTLDQIKFRWAGRESEDDDTYIDIPLSSAHPYLSTKALRSIVPNLTIDLKSRINVQNSSCPELPNLRAIYTQYYSDLDKQVKELKQRLLVITGYPLSGSGSPKKYSVDTLLNSAEEVEKRKAVEGNSERKVSKFYGLTSKYLRWKINDDGQYTL